MIGSEPYRIGGILLAAGNSSRLRQPKQFLQFNGRSLLRRAAEALCTSKCDPLIVVIGSDYERSAAELKGLGIKVIFNENWRSGMSSSICAGLENLILGVPEIDAVLISLCDQPFVNSEMLDRFGEKFEETNAPIVAAAYNGIVGVPALFSREMFGALALLAGDKGARDLIRSRLDIETVPLPEAAFDIDTPQDARWLDC